MEDHEYWIQKLRQAEAELAAAKGRTEPNAAAQRYMLAKTELKRLEASWVTDLAADGRRRAQFGCC
jgi:hypothetical protein